MVAVLASAAASFALSAGPAHASFIATVFQNYSTNNCIGISRNYAGDWICTGAGDQVWYQQGPFYANYTLSVVHNGTTYTARGTAEFWQYQDNAGNGPCLAVSTGGTSSGLQLRVWPCATSPSQNPDEWWAAVVPNFPWFPSGSGAAYLVNYHSGLAVGVSAGSGANGQPILQYTVLDHPDQWWLLFGINP